MEVILSCLSPSPKSPTAGSKACQLPPKEGSLAVHVVGSPVPALEPAAQAEVTSPPRNLLHLCHREGRECQEVLDSKGAAFLDEGSQTHRPRASFWKRW